MSMTTCFITTSDYRSIAYYSHLVPVAVSLFLAVFVLFKAKFSLLSKGFGVFVGLFCLWLIGDVVTWTQDSYHLVVASWAPLDYINVLFYLAAVYFFYVFVREKDLSTTGKIFLFALSLPAWWIAFSGLSIEGLDQPNCEAFNSQWLINYKLVVETLSVGFILILGALNIIKQKGRRSQISIVVLALALFLLAFMSTEYVAGQTGIYEINLYSLFVLPLFLAMIIFSITNLKIFAYKSFGTQLLIYILLIMVGSQYFFLQDVTYKILTLITLGLSVFLGILLASNIKREERLTLALEVANEGQTNLIHIINHQIKGYLSKSRNIFSELLTEPSYGPVSEAARPMLQEGLNSLTEGVDFVTDFLSATNIEKGQYVYNMTEFDMKGVVENVASLQKGMAEKRGLSFELNVLDGDYKMNGDKLQLEQAIRNLIDNSIKYTPTGGLRVSLERKDDKILFSVKDTGVGLSDEVKPKLFTKGGRDKDSLKININSTGFGLAFVKGVVEAHKGRVWAESEGTGKGSTFYMELPLNS